MTVSMGAIVALRPGRAPVAVAQHRHTDATTYAALVARGLRDAEAQGVVKGLLIWKGAK